MERERHRNMDFSIPIHHTLDKPGGGISPDDPFIKKIDKECLN